MEVPPNTQLPISEETSPIIDILDRQPFVDQLMNLLEMLSDARSSCTFALNGQWGTGKTFVLNMLERQLRNYKGGTQYLVFHYNCWQYDYYEEPLVAIIGAMLAEIDEYMHLVDPKIRKIVGSGCNAAKKVLREIAISFVKNKIGTDFEDIVNAVPEEKDNSQKSCEYDKFYAFSQAMSIAQTKLETLSRDQTLVIVVDELDRCLPNYAIKVLERLHHLFSDVENAVVILSIDKMQLDNTIAQIFGTKINTTAYLKKFISFETSLNSGTIEANFKKKYQNYFILFEDCPFKSSFSIDRYFSSLFSGIEIRTQERLMERIELIHKLLFGEEKKDYSFLCFELMILVFSYKQQLLSEKGTHPLPKCPLYIKLDRNFSLVIRTNNMFTSLDEYMLDWLKHQDIQYILNQDKGYLCFEDSIDIPQLMLCYSCVIYGTENEICNLENTLKPITYEDYIRDFNEILKMLDIIK